MILTYSSGLRVSEVIKLKPDDIIRSKMRLKIRQAKGHKDRYTILSETCLKYLEKYYKQYQPQNWLFPGRENKQMSIRSVQHLYYKAVKDANIKRKGGIHTLRHSFATHLKEKGVDLKTLQALLGHKSIKTTTVYIHLAESVCKEIKSPL